MKWILLASLLFIPTTVFAAGIQVSPEKLEFNEQDNLQTKEIIVVNPTGDVQLFQIYADDYERAIIANPSSFTLEAGGRKKVAVSVDLSKASGAISTSLSVVSEPLVESIVQVNTGVKIPITIVSKSSAQPSTIWLVGISLVVIGGYGYWLTRKSTD